MKLNFVGDFFNVFNSTKVRLPDQNFQLTVGSPNVDFLKPSSGGFGSRGYYLPFNMRFGISWMVILIPSCGRLKGGERKLSPLVFFAVM